MPSVETQAMDRLVIMQKEALVSINANVDAVPFFPHSQEAFPYWVNWLRRGSPSSAGEDIRMDGYSVMMRLVMGHITEDYSGELLTLAYEYIPAVVDFFATRPFLTNATDTTPLDFIHPEGAEIVDFIGPHGFQNSGLGVTQVGVEFTLSLPIMNSVY